MVEIISKARELSDFIKKSDYYLDYLSAKSRIGDNSKLKSDINYYKEKHLEYQTKVLSGQEPSFEEEKCVSTLYHSLLLNEDAKCFLESEENIIKIYKNIFDFMPDILN